MPRAYQLSIYARLHAPCRSAAASIGRLNIITEPRYTSPPPSSIAGAKKFLRARCSLHT